MSSTHPNLKMELQILKLNETKFRNQILNDMTLEQIKLQRDFIEKKILSFIIIKLRDIIDSKSKLYDMIQEIKSSDFDSLFSFHS